MPELVKATVSPSLPSLTVAVRVDTWPATGSGFTSNVVEVCWTGSVTVTIDCPELDPARVEVVTKLACTRPLSLSTRTLRALTAFAVAAPFWETAFASSRCSKPAMLASPSVP